VDAQRKPAAKRYSETELDALIETERRRLELEFNERELLIRREEKHRAAIEIVRAMTYRMPTAEERAGLLAETISEAMHVKLLKGQSRVQALELWAERNGWSAQEMWAEYKRQHPIYTRKRAA